MPALPPEYAGLGLEPYCRHDPVTGQLRCFVRSRHAIAHSPRLVAFRGCVRRLLAGRRYRGHGPREDSREVRAALAQASRECSREVRAAAPAGIGVGRRG
jgi:hypothetical protein